jgi:hypothetical protein
MAYKSQLIGRASTLEDLVERKQACLKVRSACQAIRWMVLRFNSYMIDTLGN